MMTRLLMIEDHADIRRLIRLTLEFAEFECDVHEAADGQTGLAAARSLRPDVVLLDVMMPGGVDGLSLCRQLKAEPALQGTHIVMLTARGSAVDRESGLTAGADAYLVKPFSPLQLLETIGELPLAA